MSETMKFPGKLIFGLDIGTRSVVGTVGYRVGEKFHVVSQSIREHGTRAMLDGQIHDIYKVGATINDVKTELEQRVGRTLKELDVRRTYEVNVVGMKREDRVEISLDPDLPLEEEMILMLIGSNEALEKI